MNGTTLEVGYVGAITRNLSTSIGNYNVGNHLSKLIGKVQRLEPSGLSNYDSLQAKVDRRFLNAALKSQHLEGYWPEYAADGNPLANSVAAAR